MASNSGSCSHIYILSTMSTKFALQTCHSVTAMAMAGE